MAEEIWQGIYLVGSPELTASEDACVYLIEFPSELVLIDSGAGDSVERIIAQIESLGLSPQKVKKLILTHCHIDHSGGANAFKHKLGVEIIAHKRSADILEKADPILTAGIWYGIKPEPVYVDQVFDDEQMEIKIDGEILHLLYIPGHSPGSIAVYLDRAGKRVLFGQDVHGPLHPALGSDKEQYQKSLYKLISLEADILCEGHFGIYRGKEEVKNYIQRFVD